MNPLYFIFFGCFFVLANCKAPQSTVANAEKVTQGIAGRVLWREGNFMPTINGNNENRSVGVSREIFIYELTKTSEATKKDDFFSDVKTKLVATTTSNPNGTFKTALPTGTYSIFTKEEGGLFANIFDGENNIFPVTVDSQRVTELTIIVDYKAAY